MFYIYSYDFDNPLPDIPKKATIAEVFKRCPEIEKSCLKLKKLAYRYVKEIRGEYHFLGDNNE